MALLTKSSDYTDRDFASWLSRLRSLIVSTFPDWTDTQVANFGNLLVELYAYLGDSLAYYQDNQAAEARITTATQRKNLLALAKLLNYTPKGAKAATVAVTFTLSAAVPVGRTVTFNPPATPTPTNAVTVKTEDASSPVEFQLLAPAVITAGNTIAIATCENSVKQGPESFTSTALGNQEYRLTKTPFLDDSATVVADDGTYTKVTNFLQSTSADRHFMVIVDDQDRATIRFGNGTLGKIPVGTIVVNYKTGGGLVGNVPAATIKKIDGSFVDSAGDPVTVTVTNVSAATGGDDRESNERIRENAPLSIRTLTRTVTRTDFETNALLVAGIDRALMLTRTEDTTIAENAGKLYVVPTGLGFPSLNLKNQVLSKVITDFPCTITFTPQVVDPIYLDIGVKATLFTKPGYDVATVKTNIRNALVAFFALRLSSGAKNTLIDFGFNLKLANGNPANEIALSDVFNVVRDIDGVREIGDALVDFQLSAYRVITTTLAYSGGGSPAVLVQALAHTDVPVLITDFPRLKMSTFGGTTPDIDLTIDGVNYPPGA